MKVLSVVAYAGIIIAAVAASFSGASAVPTDEMDGAPSSLLTVFGETSSPRPLDCFILRKITYTTSMNEECIHSHHLVRVNSAPFF